MPHIPYIPYDDASGELKKLYEKFAGHRENTPDNIIRISGPNPGVMDGHIHLYKEIMHKQSPLSRLQREMIAVTVSGINGCHY